MEKALEELSASALRNILIEEIKKFIICLDHSSNKELDEMKLHLRRIFDLITQREEEENALLPWGKNSTKTAEKPPTDFIDGIASGLCAS